MPLSFSFRRKGAPRKGGKRKGGKGSSSSQSAHARLFFHQHGGSTDQEISWSDDDEKEEVEQNERSTTTTPGAGDCIGSASAGATPPKNINFRGGLFRRGSSSTAATADSIGSSGSGGSPGTTKSAHVRRLFRGVEENLNQELSPAAARRAGGGGRPRSSSAHCRFFRGGAGDDNDDEENEMVINSASRLFSAGREKTLAGEHRAALSFYNTALPLQRRAFGEDSPEAARTLDAIGASLAEMGESYPALVALKEALHIRQKLESEGEEARARSCKKKAPEEEESYGTEMITLERGEGGVGSEHAGGGGGGNNNGEENADDVAETMNRLWLLLHGVRAREEQAEAEAEARREKLKEGSSGAKSARNVPATAAAADGTQRTREGLGETLCVTPRRRGSM